jgi:hypothetical protein
MDRRAFCFVLAAAGWAVIAGQQALGQAASSEPDTLAFRILKWSPEDQIAWINTTLDKGNAV